MTIELYMVPTSPPVRAVQMTAKALDIKLKLKPVEWIRHKSQSFLKLNPQNTVPVINDGGVILWDSHAINAYLVSKYGKNDSLYPKDLVKRAIVDQRLHFDTGILFARMTAHLRPVLFGQKKTIEKAQIESFHEAYEFLEKFLEGRKWIAGNSVTIADYSIYTTLGLVKLLVPVNPEKFSKLSAWYKNADSLPESDVTKEGLKIASDFLQKSLK